MTDHWLRRGSAERRNLSTPILESVGAGLVLSWLAALAGQLALGGVPV